MMSGRKVGDLRVNEQDRRAVENIALTGMDIDGLYVCFPNFPMEEIKQIFNETRNQSEDGEDSNVISVNCS